jgi:hypothetical protein
VTETEVSQHTPNEAIRQPVTISEVTSDPTINKILSDAECFAPFLEKIKVFASLAEGFAEVRLSKLDMSLPLSI